MELALLASAAVQDPPGAGEATRFQGRCRRAWVLGGQQEAEKHQMAEQKGLWAEQQCTSPLPSPCHSVTVGLGSPSALRRPLTVPRQRPES